MVGRNSRAKRHRRLGAVGSSLTAAAVALSLIIQLIASAHRQTQAAPAPAAPNPAAARLAAQAAVFSQTRRLTFMSPPVRSPLAGAAAVWLTPAYPHAVCGDRIFPATLAIDDPGVSDELALPTISWVPFNSDGAHELDASLSWTKTITPRLGLSVSAGPTWEHPGGYGWDALDTELKYQALCIPDAEFMFSVGFDITWAGTGREPRPAPAR